MVSHKRRGIKTLKIPNDFLGFHYIWRRKKGTLKDDVERGNQYKSDEMDKFKDL
jgi:hypothetical protein